MAAIMESEKKLEFSSPSIADVLAFEHYVWFFENKRQALCRVDLETKEVVIEFVWYTNSPIFVCKIIQYNKKIFLFSAKGSYVLIYNVETKALHTVHNKEQCHGETVERHNNFCARYRNKVFLFSLEMLCCEGKLETATFDLEQENFINTVFLPLTESIENGYYHFYYPSMNGSIVYNALVGTNQYLLFNLEAGRYEVKRLPDENIHLSAIFSDEHGLWMTQKDRSEVIYSSHKLENRLEFLIVSENEGEELYSYIDCFSRYIIALPRYGKRIALVERASKTIHSLFLCEDEWEKIKGGASKCVSYITNNGKVYLFPLSMKHGTIINLEDMTTEAFRLWQKKDNQILMYHSTLKFYTEDEIIDLRAFLNSMKITQNSVNTSLSLKTTTGNIIYQEIKGDSDE